LLQRIANDQQRPHIFLDLQVLRGGDPLAVVEAARQKEREQSSKHGEFAFRAIFLDRDRLGQSPARDDQIPAITAAGDFLLIWQRPCFEGFLLRHLPGCEAHQPATSALANAAIRRQWPDYRKPMPQRRLATRIQYDDIRAVAAVEPDLHAFLTAICFLT
jgi:hypothetical protein